MKKLLLFLFISFIGISTATLNAQFRTFTPFIPEGSSPSKSAPVEQVYGYVPTSSGWVRVHLKVQMSQYGVTVVGYKDKNNTGYNQYFRSSGGEDWKFCRTGAQRVSEFSDGREIANNFDFKAYITGLGTVYF